MAKGEAAAPSSSEGSADPGVPPVPDTPGFRLWQASNGWQRQVRSTLAPAGLTYVQFVLLAGLGARDGDAVAVNQAALAQSLDLDVMMTSQVLRSLEAAKLVRRDPDPGDTRARRLALTDAGREKLAAAWPLILALDETYFGVLGKRTGRFEKLLKKLWRQRGTPSRRKAEAADPLDSPATRPIKRR